MGTVNQQHTEHPLLRLTFTASGVVSAKRFIRTTGAQCSTKGQRAAGVSVDAAADGYTYTATVKGTALVCAGENLALGTEVTADANGKARKATVGNYVNGVVLRAQGVPGQDVEIQLTGPKISTLAATTTSTTTTSTTTSTSSTSSTSN
jgi:hypothetical protein